MFEFKDGHLMLGGVPISSESSLSVSLDALNLLMVEAFTLPLESSTGDEERRAEAEEAVLASMFEARHTLRNRVLSSLHLAIRGVLDGSSTEAVYVGSGFLWGRVLRMGGNGIELYGCFDGQTRVVPISYLSRTLPVYSAQLPTLASDILIHHLIRAHHTWYAAEPKNGLCEVHLSEDRPEAERKLSNSGYTRIGELWCHPRNLRLRLVERELEGRPSWAAVFFEEDNDGRKPQV